MFQSTRPRGARRRIRARSAGARMFQSTRPRGARPRTRDCPTAYQVSIHAPARGATGVQYRPRAGSEFQSTRPRGARRRDEFTLAVAFRFQSTRPRGARRGTMTHKKLLRWFQSTRPRGARRCRSCIRLRWACFNPRARAGRDGYSVAGAASCACFNPRARAGRDATQAKSNSCEAWATSPANHCANLCGPGLDVARHLAKSHVAKEIPRARSPSGTDDSLGFAHGLRLSKVLAGRTPAWPRHARRAASSSSRENKTAGCLRLP